jgi:hypothetical protein
MSPLELTSSESCAFIAVYFSEASLADEAKAVCINLP